MKRLVIFYLGITISIAFDQMQGGYFPVKRFPYSDISMILPEYLSWISRYITVIVFTWMFYFDSITYKKGMLVSSILITGFLVDFLLECNEGWFNVLNYPAGYRTCVIIGLASILFCVVFLKSSKVSRWLASS